MASESTTLYLKADRNVEVSKQNIMLGDLLSMECSDKTILMKVKTLRILKIRDYCLSIQDTMARFGKSPERFMRDSDYQQSIAFSVLQIGELTAGLSEEYREATKGEIQWAHIKGMRNIIVHDYGKIQLDRVWNIITEDIPVLKAFCNDQLPLEYRQDE